MPVGTNLQTDVRTSSLRLWTRLSRLAIRNRSLLADLWAAFFCGGEVLMPDQHNQRWSVWVCVSMCVRKCVKETRHTEIQIYKQKSRQFYTCTPLIEWKYSSLEFMCMFWQSSHCVWSVRICLSSNFSWNNASILQIWKGELCKRITYYRTKHIFK